jgi:CRP/FNR family cyclic AMP-dependent transcriptional regulator
MQDGRLGKHYSPGTVICQQGDKGDEMFVIQAGSVEVIRETADGSEIKLGEMGEGAVFGEMSIFTKAPRAATVRATSDARILTLDRRGFLRRVHEDPSLAFNILETLSVRIGELNNRVEALQASQGDASADSK